MQLDIGEFNQTLSSYYSLRKSLNAFLAHKKVTDFISFSGQKITVKS